MKKRSMDDCDYLSEIRAFDSVASTETNQANGSFKNGNGESNGNILLNEFKKLRLTTLPEKIDNSGTTSQCKNVATDAVENMETGELMSSESNIHSEENPTFEKNSRDELRDTNGRNGKCDELSLQADNKNQDKDKNCASQNENKINEPITNETEDCNGNDSSWSGYCVSTEAGKLTPHRAEAILVTQKICCDKEEKQLYNFSLRNYYTVIDTRLCNVILERKMTPIEKQFVQMCTFNSVALRREILTPLYEYLLPPKKVRKSKLKFILKPNESQCYASPEDVSAFEKLDEITPEEFDCNEPMVTSSIGKEHSVPLEKLACQEPTITSSVGKDSLVSPKKNACDESTITSSVEGEPLALQEKLLCDEPMKNLSMKEHSVPQQERSVNEELNTNPKFSDADEGSKFKPEDLNGNKNPLRSEGCEAEYVEHNTCDPIEEKTPECETEETESNDKENSNPHLLELEMQESPSIEMNNKKSDFLSSSQKNFDLRESNTGCYSAQNPNLRLESDVTVPGVRTVLELDREYTDSSETSCESPRKKLKTSHSIEAPKNESVAGAACKGPPVPFSEPLRSKEIETRQQIPKSSKAPSSRKPLTEVQCDALISVVENGQLDDLLKVTQVLEILIHMNAFRRFNANAEIRPHTPLNLSKLQEKEALSNYVTEISKKYEEFVKVYQNYLDEWFSRIGQLNSQTKENLCHGEPIKKEILQKMFNNQMNLRNEVLSLWTEDVVNEKCGQCLSVVGILQDQRKVRCSVAFFKRTPFGYNFPVSVLEHQSASRFHKYRDCLEGRSLIVGPFIFCFTPTRLVAGEAIQIRLSTAEKNEHLLTAYGRKSFEYTFRVKITLTWVKDAPHPLLREIIGGESKFTASSSTEERELMSIDGLEQENVSPGSISCPTRATASSDTGSQLQQSTKPSSSSPLDRMLSEENEILIAELLETLPTEMLNEELLEERFNKIIQENSARKEASSINDGASTSKSSLHDQKTNQDKRLNSVLQYLQRIASRANGTETHLADDSSGVFEFHRPLSKKHSSCIKPACYVSKKQFRVYSYTVARHYSLVDATADSLLYISDGTVDEQEYGRQVFRQIMFRAGIDAPKNPDVRTEIRLVGASRFQNYVEKTHSLKITWTEPPDTSNIEPKVTARDISGMTLGTTWPKQSSMDAPRHGSIDTGPNRELDACLDPAMNSETFPAESNSKAEETILQLEKSAVMEGIETASNACSRDASCLPVGNPPVNDREPSSLATPALSCRSDAAKTSSPQIKVSETPFTSASVSRNSFEHCLKMGALLYPCMQRTVTDEGEVVRTFELTLVEALTTFSDEVKCLDLTDKLRPTLRAGNHEEDLQDYEVSLLQRPLSLASLSGVGVNDAIERLTPRILATARSTERGSCIIYGKLPDRTLVHGQDQLAPAFALQLAEYLGYCHGVLILRQNMVGVGLPTFEFQDLLEHHDELIKSLIEDAQVSLAGMEDFMLNEGKEYADVWKYIYERFSTRSKTCFEDLMSGFSSHCMNFVTLVNGCVAPTNIVVHSTKEQITDIYLARWCFGHENYCVYDLLCLIVLCTDACASPPYLSGLVVAYMEALESTVSTTGLTLKLTEHSLKCMMEYCSKRLVLQMLAQPTMFFAGDWRPQLLRAVRNTMYFLDHRPGPQQNPQAGLSLSKD